MTAPGEGKGRGNQDAAGYGKAYEVIAASIQLASAVILMLLLGQWLDGKFGTAPWLMLAGLVAGFSAGMYSFLRKVGKTAGNDQDTGNQG